MGFFNYFIDPYNIFNSNILCINPNFNDNPYLQIKLSKNKQSENVIIGGSSAKYLKVQNYEPNINDISTYYATINEIQNILFYYLDLHPETKTVYFTLEYKLFDKRENEIKPNTKNYLTIKELYKLFLSFDTLKLSIKKLKTKNLTINSEVKLINLEDEFKNSKINRIIPPKDKEEYTKYAIENLSEIFKELKRRNIKIVCFMPPFHANYQLRMEENFKDSIAQIKKYVVIETGSLIDMEMVNEYSTMPIKTSNEYFLDEIHISDQYTKQLYNIIFNPTVEDKNLFVVLTKENIDSELIKRREQLLKYKKDYQQEYTQYRKRESAKWKKFHKKLN